MQKIPLQNERGMILFSSLAILSVLLAVGIAIRVMLQNDYRVLTNLRAGTEAFYYSVAGLEWGKNELAEATTFPPAPANQIRAFATGQFAVSFVSPAAIGPLSARVIVRSTGTIGAASHTLQAGLIKTYDLADAAIGLRGSVSGVNFGEYPILISGLDHDAATGSPTSGAPSRSAMSTADEAAQALVLAALGDPPRDILENGADTPVMSLSGYLSSSTVTQLSNGLCQSPGVLATTVPDSGTLGVQDQAWGNRDAPQVRCFHGLQASGDSVNLNGTVTGAGILIIKDADLVVSGALRWEGLIIISGGEVSLKITGSGEKEILGGLIVNETGIPGSDSRILDIQGNMRLLFSRQALNGAAGLIPSAVLSNIYTILPSVISQQYWRAVNP